jgi:hypothetical protein
MENTEHIQRTQQEAQTLGGHDVTVLKVPREQLLKPSYPHALPIEVIEAAERTHTLYLSPRGPSTGPFGSSVGQYLRRSR